METDPPDRHMRESRRVRLDRTRQGAEAMQTRQFRDLEVFLGEQGLDLDHRAFELELNSHGWRVAAERSTR